MRGKNGIFVQRQTTTCTLSILYHAVFGVEHRTHTMVTSYSWRGILSLSYPSTAAPPHAQRMLLGWTSLLSKTAKRNSEPCRRPLKASRTTAATTTHTRYGHHEQTRITRENKQSGTRRAVAAAPPQQGSAAYMYEAPAVRKELRIFKTTAAPLMCCGDGIYSSTTHRLVQSPGGEGLLTPWGDSTKKAPRIYARDKTGKRVAKLLVLTGQVSHHHVRLSLGPSLR